VVFTLGHVAEVFDEVHYVCAVVHGILSFIQHEPVLLSALGRGRTRGIGVLVLIVRECMSGDLRPCLCI